ncbi:MAG TPA: phosphoribosylanthranilate isomerase [Bryobacteraceae bacterium]|nr:phosphoribosylanthranilate isomerase [Bryobacteraceae bacterium]
MVKICGVTTAEDALASAEAGASAIGLNFYPGSPRYLDFERARAIGRCLNGGVLKVGVFVNATPELLEQAVDAAGLDVVQLHGEVPSSVPAAVSVWRAYRADERFSPELIAGVKADAILLDSAGPGFGGSGETFDWEIARGLSAKLVLAGGLHASNVAEAIRIARPWGVDACSKLESTPGRKDHKKVAAFIQAALKANT